MSGNGVRKFKNPRLTDPQLFVVTVENRKYRLVTDGELSLSTPGSTYLSATGKDFYLAEICHPRRLSPAGTTVTFKVRGLEVFGGLTYTDETPTNAFKGSLNSEPYVDLTFRRHPGEIHLNKARFYGPPSGLVGLHLLTSGVDTFLVARSLDGADGPGLRFYYNEFNELVDVTDRVEYTLSADGLMRDFLLTDLGLRAEITYDEVADSYAATVNGKDADMDTVGVHNLTFTGIRNDMVLVHSTQQ